MAGEGWLANSAPREKGIVASRCKIQRSRLRGLGGQPQGDGEGTMENGIVASRGLSQITKLGPPIGTSRREGAMGQQWTSGKGYSCLQTQNSKGQTQAPGGPTSGACGGAETMEKGYDC